MSDETPVDADLLRTDLHIQAAYKLTEALAASEKKMRRRVELLSEVVFETDSAGLLQFLNRAWEDISGYSPKESIGTALEQYIFAEDRPQFRRYVERARADGARRPVEIRLVSKANNLVSVEVSTTSLEEGGMVGTVYNVTDRNLAEAELKKLSMVASFTDSMVLITDAAGCIEWVNQAFVRQTGFTAEESVGKKPGAILQGPGTDLEDVLRIREGLASSRSFECQILNYTKSGKEYWVALFITPIFGEDGKLERFISVQTDITVIRQMQSELQTATKAAERASEAKSAFLAAMSHEIRTPLNGVLGMTSLLLDGSLEEGQRQRANIIRSSGEALVTIVNDILDYSKIEAGRFSLATERLLPKTVLEDTVNLFRGNAETQGLSLTGAFSGDETVAVLGDGGRLRQILMNLVSNAVKFTPKGSVIVEMQLTAEPDSAHIRAQVTDTGIGVAPEDLDRLFVHFSQVDGSPTRKKGGTGLGLAISKQLVEMMGGSIGVETARNTGSTFWFEMTLPTAEVETAKPPVEPLSALGFEGLRVLVAEDNLVNQIVLKGILDLLGCQVDIASNGVEAVESIRKADYDFVLMDVHMPEMDGLEATREIRNSSRVPIVAVTANILAEQVQVCFECGMDGFVPKPISRHSIETELARILSASGRPPSAPITSDP